MQHGNQQGDAVRQKPCVNAQLLSSFFYFLSEKKKKMYFINFEPMKSINKSLLLNI